MKAIVNGKLILPDRIIEDGAVLFDEKIKAAGEAGSIGIPEDAFLIDAEGRYIAPGFIDIHCHGALGSWCYEEPEKISRFHLEHGTTSLLCSIPYNLDHKGYIDGIDKIKEAYRKDLPGNIEGIHMECPYINPDFGGRSSGKVYKVVKEEYEEYIKHADGLIRQWTFSPELEDLDGFVAAALSNGIPLAMGHSKAGPETVDKYYKLGARIVTHMFDATGCSVVPTRFRGTREPWFDECCMVYDDIYAEIVPDSDGIHVRPVMLKLAYKTMGDDRLVIITDASEMSKGDDEADINIENGELCGSRMTMDRACANMMDHTGCDMRSLFKMASVNPAMAVGIYDHAGSLEEGKHANILVTDADMKLSAVFLKGAKIR